MLKITACCLLCLKTHLLPWPAHTSCAVSCWAPPAEWPQHPALQQEPLQNCWTVNALIWNLWQSCLSTPLVSRPWVRGQQHAGLRPWTMHLPVLAMRCTWHAGCDLRQGAPILLFFPHLLLCLRFRCEGSSWLRSCLRNGCSWLLCSSILCNHVLCQLQVGHVAQSCQAFFAVPGMQKASLGSRCCL